MINPILRIRYPIQRCALDIDVLIRSVEVDVANRRRLARDGVSYRYRGKEGRRDEVDILARVGEDLVRLKSAGVG